MDMDHVLSQWKFSCLSLKKFKEFSLKPLSRDSSSSVCDKQNLNTSTHFSKLTSSLFGYYSKPDYIVNFIFGTFSNGGIGGPEKGQLYSIQFVRLSSISTRIRIGLSSRMQVIIFLKVFLGVHLQYSEGIRVILS